MAASLTAVERELLELCYLDAEGGEPTTGRYAELQSPPDRATLEATLCGLVDRGLMTRWRGTYVGDQRDRRTGEVTSVEYEDDWWPVAEPGRAAIGLPPRAQTAEEGWTNPPSGYWRVSPLIAPYCAWRFRHGKPHIPGWYARLTGKEALSPDE
jgi:hypothetical protein